jgi:HSP20 family protein
MATSFFEKLTGTSNEEEIKPSIDTEEEIIEKPKRGRPKKKPIEEKSIKKEPVPKEIETKEKPSFADPPAGEAGATKGKDWLEEVEGGEEGQLTIDVYQTDSDIIIKSTIAGVNPENIDVSITNDMVTIRGKRIKDETVEAENYYYQELYWGAFSRSVILPVEVDSDKAKASIKNGILTIKLPKSEKIKTKKIQVLNTG